MTIIFISLAGIYYFITYEDSSDIRDLLDFALLINIRLPYLKHNIIIIL